MKESVKKTLYELLALFVFFASIQVIGFVGLVLWYFMSIWGMNDWQTWGSIIVAIFILDIPAAFLINHLLNKRDGLKKTS